MNQYLTQEQMNYLSSDLQHNCCDAWLVIDGYSTYTTGDLLEMLPKELTDHTDTYKLEIWTDKVEDDVDFWYIAYIPTEDSESEVELCFTEWISLCDAAYDMLTNLIKQGYAS